MTRNEVEAVLGVSLTRSAMSHDAEYQLAGIEGQLALYFHDGCLATMLFVIREENATVEAFRTLHRWAQRELDGQVDTARCESEEGIPLATHIANGHGQLNAMWRDAEPFEASLHLRSLYGRNGHTELIFEASYMPLRPYAPRIDF